MNTPKHDSIEIAYDDGKRIFIKRSSITAVEGNTESTTIYFGGDSVSVLRPLSDILAVLGAKLPSQQSMANPLYQWVRYIFPKKRLAAG